MFIKSLNNVKSITNTSKVLFAHHPQTHSSPFLQVGIWDEFFQVTFCIFLHKNMYVRLVFHMHDILITLQLAFVLQQYLLRSCLSMPARFMPFNCCTIICEGCASAEDGSVQLDSTASSDSMSLSTSSSHSHEQVVVWGTHQEVDRLCHCFFDRAS